MWGTLSVKTISSPPVLRTIEQVSLVVWGLISLGEWRI